MNIGLLDQVRLSASQQRKVAAIQGYDFSKVRELFLREEPSYAKDRAKLDQLEMELKRFFVLFVVDPGKPHVISERADKLWHAFLMDTKLYREFCKATIGITIDHLPVLPKDKAQWAEYRRHTKRVYRDYFGIPQDGFWTAGEMLCWGCGER